MRPARHRLRNCAVGFISSSLRFMPAGILGDGYLSSQYRSDLALAKNLSHLVTNPNNTVVLPYVSMHGSIRQMVDDLVAALVERGVSAEQFNLAVSDIGKVAITLVDVIAKKYRDKGMMRAGEPNGTR